METPVNKGELSQTCLGARAPKVSNRFLISTPVMWLLSRFNCSTTIYPTVRLSVAQFVCRNCLAGAMQAFSVSLTPTRDYLNPCACWRMKQATLHHRLLTACNNFVPCLLVSSAFRRLLIDQTGYFPTKTQGRVTPPGLICSRLPGIMTLYILLSLTFSQWNNLAKKHFP